MKILNFFGFIIIFQILSKRILIFLFSLNDCTPLNHNELQKLLLKKNSSLEVEIFQKVYFTLLLKECSTLRIVKDSLIAVSNGTTHKI